MTAHDNIEQKLEQLAQAIDSKDSIVQSVMSRIEAQPKGRARKGENQKNIPMIRRIIMNRYTKFAAAAVIVIGVIAGSVMIDGPGSSAYALDHTIHANHGVRCIHIKDFKTSVGTADGFVDLLEGDVDFDAVKAALGEVGYDGYVTAEMLPFEPGRPEKTAQAMKKIFK